MYNDDHRMLREAVGDFLSDCAGVERVRQRQVLSDELGELGWTGLLIDESYGGAGVDIVSASILAQEIGGHLALTPLLSNALIASYAIQRLGSDAQKEEYLPRIAAGEFAVGNGLGDHKSTVNGMSADGGIAVSGSIELVPYLRFATSLLLPVAIDDEERICIVATGAENFHGEAYITFDNREFGRVTLNSVRVDERNICPGSGVVGIRAFGTLLYASEQLGAARAAFDLAVNYLKERKQFGRLIGSFQALQHRAAVLYTELELLEALVLKASMALQNGSPDARALCSMAKAKAGTVSATVANEVIQFHGGIGMTDEYDAGFYVKRIAVTEKLYGDSDYHTDRVAEMSGF